MSSNVTIGDKDNSFYLKYTNKMHFFNHLTFFSSRGRKKCLFITLFQNIVVHLPRFKQRAQITDR